MSANIEMYFEIQNTHREHESGVFLEMFCGEIEGEIHYKS